MTQSTEAMRLTDDEAYVTHLLSCALTGAVPLPLPGGGQAGRAPSGLPRQTR